MFVLVGSWVRGSVGFGLVWCSVMSWLLWVVGLG